MQRNRLAFDDHLICTDADCKRCVDQVLDDQLGPLGGCRMVVSGEFGSPTWVVYSDSIHEGSRQMYVLNTGEIVRS